MVLGTVAEYSLPLTMAPVLVDLARALAEDKNALNGIQLSRTTASYKMTHGLAHSLRDRILECIRRYPFSVNMDEATSNNYKKVLAVLVCYYNPVTQTVDLEHLGSLEILKTNSESVYKALEKLFEDNNIPWDNLISMLLDSCAVMRGN